MCIRDRSTQSTWDFTSFMEQVEASTANKKGNIVVHTPEAIEKDAGVGVPAPPKSGVENNERDYSIGEKKTIEPRRVSSTSHKKFFHHSTAAKEFIISENLRKAEERAKNQTYEYSVEMIQVKDMRWTVSIERALKQRGIVWSKVLKKEDIPKMAARDTARRLLVMKSNLRTMKDLSLIHI
eukprot:TRINITY_DN6667_c0_g1_i2.p1 TRINITY_DN6667_c0_g1~~TRINITY_DN6667_c0_g1_i2.p1  ORF type:complete len:211 (-),score=42.74 TRINITY_DN6667_c0_g1_i2:60-602(-)